MTHQDWRKRALKLGVGTCRDNLDAALCANREADRHGDWAKCRATARRAAEARTLIASVADMRVPDNRAEFRRLLAEYEEKK